MGSQNRPYQRPKLSDSARGARGLQPERDGRVRWSAWLGLVWFIFTEQFAHAANVGKQALSGQVASVVHTLVILPRVSFKIIFGNRLTEACDAVASPLQ